MKALSKLLILFFLLPCFLWADNNPMSGRYTKEKKIEKRFDVNKSATLKVNNRYGNVDITTWNQNHIEIEVTITTNGNNEQEVQKRLDGISVDFTTTKSLVSAQTIIGSQRSSWSFWGSRTANVNMKINYLIKMPVSNSLDLKNDYGAISLNRLNGNANISCNYGTFIIGELHGNNNTLNFDYTTNATIGYAKNVTINADYAEYVLNKTEQITYKGNYSRAEIKEVISSLDFNCAYGRLNIGKAKSIKGRSRYVTTNFGSVSEHLDLQSNYGRISVGLLEKNISTVVINAKYTSIDMTYDANASFDLSASTSYARIRGIDRFELSLQDIRNTRSEYAGHYGRKNSGNTVQISSSYGNVTLQKK